MSHMGVCGIFVFRGGCGAAGNSQKRLCSLECAFGHWRHQTKGWIGQTDWSEIADFPQHPVRPIHPFV